jgi:hypothetical protein
VSPRAVLCCRAFGRSKTPRSGPQQPSGSWGPSFFSASPAYLTIAHSTSAWLGWPKKPGGRCCDELGSSMSPCASLGRGLLCPFDYYGVPDEVDYANIPWRSRRFDEEALTVAVATRARSLERLEAGELEAQDILRSLLRSTTAGEQLEEYYRDFREMRGTRPLAGEAFLDGFNPRATRRAGHGSWLDFVQAMGDLDPEQKKVREHLGAFLEQLEVTPMTRSYKMLVLQAMLGEDAFPGSISLDRLGERFGDFARRYSSLRTEVGEAMEDPQKMRQLLVDNPIAAWVGGAGTGGTSYFRFEDDTFSTTFTVPDELREATQDLVEELVEWRLGEYLQRSAVARGPDRFVCRVSHAGGRPILFLPDRERTPGLPEGMAGRVGGGGPPPGEVREGGPERGDPSRERRERAAGHPPAVVRAPGGPAGAEPRGPVRDVGGCVPDEGGGGGGVQTSANGSQPRLTTRESPCLT